MERFVAIEESTANGITRPTTLSFRPEFALLHIAKQCRQVLDFDKVGQSKDRPNANRFYLENGFGTSVVVQFIVGIEDRKTNELWNCSIKNKQRKLVLENGLFSIEVEISPNGLVCFPQTDMNIIQLPNYLANVKCVLPVEDDPIDYNVKIMLYQSNCGVKKFLDCVQYIVHTHDRDHDVYDYQEGRGIVEVERPQLKIKMSGILAENIGRRIIMFFQNLGDNGLYDQFYMEQKKLLEGLAKLEERFGQGHFKDVELSVKLEESIFLFGKNKMEDCLRTAMEVINYVMVKNISNGTFLMGKAHYIISAVYRQGGDFDVAKEHMEKSTELLETVVVCEETAVNQYNYAALLSEKAANSPLSLVEQKDAEFRFKNCLLLWRHQTQNETNRCPMRAQIRKINFHLRTSRQSFPDERKPVNEDGLIRAAQEIKYAHDHLLETCSQRHNVTFYIAESDYYIRLAMMNGPPYTLENKKQNALEANSILKKSLKTAIKLKLQKEIDGIIDRMQNLSRLFGTQWENEYQQMLHRHRRKQAEAEEHDYITIVNLMDKLEQVSLELLQIE